MKVGLKDFHQIEEDYYMVDSKIINGDLWALYENYDYGEDVKLIAINLTRSFYVYTFETLGYVYENLDEYEMYSL